jgi:hypothetical protein
MSGEGLILGRHIVDWLGALSGIGGTGIAAFVAYLGYKEFLRTPQQEEAGSDTATADDTDAEALPLAEVFRTSNQTTTLRVTARGLECHLDDERSGRGGHQWTIAPAEARRILQSGAYSVNPSYRARTGRFNIGSRRNWLYSKALFPEPDYLHGTLKELLSAAAASAA